MTTVDGRTTLDREAERLAYKPPEVRHDTQGDMTTEQRVETAMHHFVKDFNTQTASYLDGCVHCGMCADACHYFVRTDDPRYTPIWKMELFKQAYKREVGPFAFFYRLFGFKKKVTIDQLEEWQHLLYDSCTVCGRCSLVCPMGIDIAGMVSMARHGMFKAGLIPHELHETAKRAAETGSPLGITPEKFKERVEWMADEHEVDIPLNVEKADVLAVMSSIEIQKYPESIAATAKILNATGESWTFSTDGYEATNFGMLSGNLEWQKAASMKLIDTAIKLGAKTLVLPECGHAYMAMRWMGANMYGKPLPFKVLHITEYLADVMNSGRLKVKKVDKSVTFHDPCQVSRRGGATQAPRDVLKHLGVDFREMPNGGDYNWCCGGGGGVITIKRADELRHRVFKLKMDQMEATGAEELLSSCANCRQSFDDSEQHFGWNHSMGSLMEMVAENLEEQKS
ncbi:MAG: (Fe-S)-binding protein [Gammaproteobacteria bacterium]|nr:(Fe-S)-binding protein [Gammaproteobacteria bacterium]MBT8111190.1 (Fe-S)-binding protein [Gammaproteobacteria bacterium]NND46367.1 (Fe-S)-binding protein [Woeseiaceae bacterium]NNL45888.1 (Fe-S)-binding protein [Woeseiaceae bacterium]